MKRDMKKIMTLCEQMLVLLEECETHNLEDLIEDIKKDAPDSMDLFLKFYANSFSFIEDLPRVMIVFDNMEKDSQFVMRLCTYLSKCVNNKNYILANKLIEKYITTNDSEINNIENVIGYLITCYFVKDVLYNKIICDMLIEKMKIKYGTDFEYKYTRLLTEHYLNDPCSLTSVIIYLFQRQNMINKQLFNISFNPPLKKKNSQKRKVDIFHSFKGVVNYMEIMSSTNEEYKKAYLEMNVVLGKIWKMEISSNISVKGNGKVKRL